MSQSKIIGLRLPHYSKHRQFDDDGYHIPGACKISNHSSLRKLMRAARRGKLPEERLFIINGAIGSAALRRDAYKNSQATR